jgi:sarcosine oxidase gamma subunit
MTNNDTGVALGTTDDLGRAIALRLAKPQLDVSHEVAERLKSARMLALEKRRQVAVQTAQVTSQQGGTATLTMAGGDRWSLWHLAGSVLPLLALVAGLIAIDYAQDDYRAREIADVDVELLTDDLPPAAFTDPGFVQFLRTERTN